MSKINLTPSEFVNFCKLAKSYREKFTHTIIKGQIIVSASSIFLEKIGF